MPSFSKSLLPLETADPDVESPSIRSPSPLQRQRPTKSSGSRSALIRWVFRSIRQSKLLWFISICVIGCLVYLLVVWIIRQFRVRYITVAHPFDSRVLQLPIPAYTEHFVLNARKSPLLEQTIIANRKQTSLPLNRTGNSNTTVAMVTILAPGVSIEADLKTYASYGLSNLIEYANRHRYPFFFQHPSLNDVQGKDVFWHKVDVLREFMGPTSPYEWILWTDLDVLILNVTKPLTDFVDKIPKKYDFGIVLECHRTDIYDLQYSIRSGFFFVRAKSPSAIAFMKEWSDLRKNPQFSDDPTPEQKGLEYLFSGGTGKWGEKSFVMEMGKVHCYAECATHETFSVHFPNIDRKWYVKEWFEAFFPEAWRALPIRWPYSLVRFDEG